MESLPATKKGASNSVRQLKRIWEFCTISKNDCCKYLLVFLIYFLSENNSFAQHDMGNMQMEPDSMVVEMGGMKMTSSFSVNLPMNRDGSGTSWQPDASPMFMYHKMLGGDKYGMTSLMVHGSFFIRYTAQDITKESNRGGNHFDAPNMMMFMLTHQHPKDIFSVRSMFSLDPFTVGLDGYPLLFQTGESYQGIPLVDRQHPHDLFAELALNYSHSFTKDVDVNTYFGYPGEPALGPSVFMHRLSAMNNPDATLGHHWQDATHITFGVATMGIHYKMVKVEGSIFTGREPDEHRYNFDKPKFDSYSYRINANPNQNFSLQFSQGFIKSPEELFPDENIIRTTASVIHTKLFKHGKFIATSLVWGMNHSTEGDILHSLLLESNLKLAPIAIYMHYEFVQKDAHELQLLEYADNSIFNIYAFTLGLNRILFTQFRTDVSAGVQGTVNFPDKSLEYIYGNHPLAFEIYLRIAPTSEHHDH